MSRYVEFSFDLPFFDLIDDPDQLSRLEELMQILDIHFEPTDLHHRYLSYGVGIDQVGKGDVFVFFYKDNQDRFILIDLFREFTDQYNMVKLGARCEAKNNPMLDELVLELCYSDFLIEFWEG